MMRHKWLATILAISTSALAQEPGPKRILYVGDSLSVGGFGTALEAGLAAIPDTQVARYASCGSMVAHWFSGAVTVCGLRESWPTESGRRQVAVSPRRCPKKTPKCGPNGSDWKVPPVKTPIFSTLKIMGHEPDLTVIELGTNSFGNTPEELEAETRRMIEAQKKKGGQCVWVGPPDIRECAVSGGRHVTQAAIQKIYAAIENVTKDTAYSCSLIDSRKYAKFHPGAKDCLHVYTNTPSIADPWAAGVLSEIKSFINPPPQGAEPAEPSEAPRTHYERATPAAE